MIRLIAMYTYLVLFLLWSLPVMGVLRIIMIWNPDGVDRASMKIVQGFLRGLCWISKTETTVIGLERIPKEEAVVFVGNHRSYFDIIVGYGLVPGLTGVISKKEIKKIPIMNMWMWFLHCIFLDRKNIREGLKTIITGVEYLKKGYNLIIFPEGTRNMTGELTLPFKEGSMKLAEKSGCKIVPMVQCNTAACYENNGNRVRSAHTVLEFGEPIDPKTLAPEEKKFLGAYVQKKIEEIYVKNLPLV